MQNNEVAGQEPSQFTPPVSAMAADRPTGIASPQHAELCIAGGRFEREDNAIPVHIFRNGLCVHSGFATRIRIEQTEWQVLDGGDRKGPHQTTFIDYVEGTQILAEGDIANACAGCIQGRS